MEASRPFSQGHAAADRPGDELRASALAALCLDDPAVKMAAVHTLWQQRDALPLDAGRVLDEPAPLPERPGRPARPELVGAVKVPQRSAFTPEGRSALLHAIAHIEFNAINLALDAVWRFPGLPRQFYLDWLRVAREEAEHHQLLIDHLASLGHAYGDFAAHDGLWSMARRTKDDFIARMALVPRTLEARGLDATPPLQAKFRRAGDQRSVEILDVILREEVGHVAIGNHWYRWACEQAGEDPLTLYPKLVARHEAPRLRPPFNLEARRSAGFNADELTALQSGGSA